MNNIDQCIHSIYTIDIDVSLTLYENGKRKEVHLIGGLV